MGDQPAEDDENTRSWAIIGDYNAWIGIRLLTDNGEQPGYMVRLMTGMAETTGIPTWCPITTTFSWRSSSMMTGSSRTTTSRYDSPPRYL